MLNELPTFMQLIKQLQQVPYLASKNIYRVATYFLAMDDTKAKLFCRAILEAQERIKQCDICFCWQEVDKQCMFCLSVKKDQSVVCVVETWHELMSIEKAGGYHGVFHVLGGAICPLDGIGPQQLHIAPLVERVKKGIIKEVILATNQTPEGQATAAYIAKQIQGLSVAITCLARGVPVGASLEFMDRVTVYKALSERRPF